MLLTGCTQQEISSNQTNDKDIIVDSVELDVEKERTRLTKTSDYVDAYWMRSGWFYWNDVEPEQGQFDWEFADSFITEHLEKAECLVVVIFPFTNWNQDACHGQEYLTEFDKEKSGSIKVGAPCDIEA